MKHLGSVAILAVLLAAAWGGEDPLNGQAAKGLRRAVDFFRTKVAVEGGYLWRYSDDLSRREGENKATASQAWVQPPGTPSVGQAYLRAYQATDDPYYLQAARETALALIKGQLLSGGWDYKIEFDPTKRTKYAYRVRPAGEKGFNVTTLDDNNTQESLRFLMRLDKVLGFKDQMIHEATEYALTSLLKAQYPNGAWAQRFDSAPDPAKFPVKKATYPETWSRTYPAKDYRSYYTLNDNTQADMIDVFLEAERIYGKSEYRKAALKGGDFFLLAQMPEPQPIWAQQYDADMQPAWARKFEPASVTGGESQGAMKTLLKLYRETGEKKYLEPIPRAVDFLRKHRLADGRLPRFYELQTSKPLYFTKKYELTYNDNDLPTHYGFKVSSDGVEKIAQDYEKLSKQDPTKLKTSSDPGRPTLNAALKAKAQKVLADLDGQGRWLDNGKLKDQGPNDPTTRIIDCKTFINNVNTLSDYLAATRK